MDTENAGTPPSTTEARLALIDSVLALPFPPGEESEDSGVRSSGPGHHLLILRASQDFWDDRSPEVVEPAEQEIETEFSVLATALSERWGEPATVDLWPYLEGDDDAEGEGVAPEPLGQLCQLAGSMQVWRVPGGTRWLGLAVGQADPEFPIWLLAAVGGTATLPGH
ncbi:MULTISPECIES: hypothetical protein [Streptomyces]|uniref:Uncharacterized protein n=2 Tax=Streptomyces TaxID=1883 RepID=A0A652KS36_9ACTN|nr:MULTISPECIES: hypothetical protein [unclassified Streptomyces]WSS62787.1 hypothetical protein OG284_16885 [Streptomyces sp. NBC_01177]WSS69806.1 hypothetical protein OG491_16610 [Streptomyces sp. NBC_01175]WSS76799.1 hypothetical protein OG414_16855 [Streptomyces sp. NBC_01174]MDX3328328.1 hypothetical protein [Streptomyces sp. ME02-6979-3A]MDX3429452.1 hypothetical protein [Streptomyces sp. ME01-18a]